eukprot:CAMPEP_0197029912 /NCGR_PEP_ID=MMETSP1384-20130603/9255_1 /TAXON_ID=29189 /ORGANISM="Ammonia sp." /LENGTH=179 /DNA_ID=CAMNT_0042459159 /DNA_START=87 /DNA_END=623 /DNA_ORIENTATION=-
MSSIANKELFTPIGLLNLPFKLKQLCDTPMRFVGDIDRSEEIQRIAVRNTWIYNGFLAAIGSVFSGPLTGNSVTHWWVEIQTRKGNWYCAQWEVWREGGKNCDVLVLRRCASQSAVTAAGRSTANNTDGNISTKEGPYTLGKNRKRTIGGLISEVMSEQGIYDLVSNNCQHFSIRAYNW